MLYYYSNLSVPTGRFQNRSHLVGNVLRNDGSLLLQNVQEADEGTYTCEIRFENESRVFKKSVELLVLPEEPKGMRQLLKERPEGDRWLVGEGGELISL